MREEVLPKLHEAPQANPAGGNPNDVALAINVLFKAVFSNRTRGLRYGIANPKGFFGKWGPRQWAIDSLIEEGVWNPEVEFPEWSERK